jgi:flagellar basal-body rod modification protein FlgD
MADDTKKIGGTDTTAAAAQSAISKATKNQQIGKDEFLQLLVTQLKNQDPLDPMKSEEFAVNLAQFSQLEQLVSINEKVGKDTSGELSSLAGYLGTEVTYAGDSVHVENNDGGLLKVDLGQDAANIEVQLLSANGAVRDSVSFKDVKAGKQTLSLAGLNVESGDYTIAVKGLGVNGEALTPDVKLAGIVSGFVPGDDPVLMVGGKEIRPSDVTAVNIPKA